MKKSKIDMTQIASQIVEEEIEKFEELGNQDIVFSDKFRKKMDSIVSEKGKRKFWSANTAWAAGICIFFLLQIILCGTIFQDAIIAAQIDYNLAKLENLKPEQVTSSNPYAYADEENYKNIVNMGPVAMKILDTKYQKGEIAGMSAWIAGALVEEISGIKLSSITGNPWTTGEEFFKSWDVFVKEIPHNFDEIANSSLPLDEKVEALQSYGIFGEYFLYCVEQCETEEMDFFGNTIRMSSWENCEFAKNSLSVKELNIIEKYLENKINLK